MNKLENVQSQMTLKEKDVKLFTDKYKKAKRQADVFRVEVKELENKIYKSAIYALKDQISYFKPKAKECDRLSEEIVKLKNNIKDVENVQLAINATREEVNEMLKNENNIESMAILAATLKKSLLDAERKIRDMDYNLKKAENDATRYRREVNTLECQINDLRIEMQYVKENLEKEKQYRKNKISELHKISDNLNTAETSLTRNISEILVNFNRKPHLSSPECPEQFLNETASPSVIRVN